MKDKILKVSNLDCPMCADKLETSLKAINGVGSVNVDFLLQKISVSYTTDGVLKEVIDFINNFEEVKVIDDIDHIIIKYNNVKNNDFDELEYELADFMSVTDLSIGKNTISFFLSDDSDFNEVKEIISKYVVIKEKVDYEPIFLVISLVLFGLTFVLNNGFENILIEYIGYSLVVLLSGYKVFYNTFKSIKKGMIFDENFLMSIACVGAILVSIFTDDNQMIEASLVMLLYQIGEMLQTRAVNLSRGSVSTLIKNNGNKVTLLKNGIEVKTNPKNVCVGDVIVIKPGDLVLLDSTVISGKADFDTKSITGEANPKYLSTGDDILSGYISTNGKITARVCKVYAESTLSKVEKLVENSMSQKADTEKFITKFAKVYTPIVCLISLIIAVVLPFIDYFISGSFNFSDWIIKALTVLVISCPCALVISVPLTYFNAIGVSAKNQVLVKGAQYLDVLSSVKVFLFDKTGTLTNGEFDIVDVNSNDKFLLLDVLSALEANSNHKVASSIKNHKSKLLASNISEVAGCGITGIINGKTALAGNKKLMDKYSISVEEYKGNNTVIYVVYDNLYLGYVELSDTIKEEAKDFLLDLKSNGIDKTILLTGDNKLRAMEFASNLSLDEVYSELLPEEKLNIANKYKENYKVAYVGDGINDAPVMSSVDSSFSMGKLGSDYCIEVSDFVVMEDNLNKITDTIKLSKKTKSIVMQNIVGSIIIKVILMILGFLGLIPLWVAVFGDVGVMLIAIINSFRVRRY